VPTHTVGVWGSGKSSLASGKVSYDVYIGNGPTVRQGALDFNAFTDDNADKMIGFNLGYQPYGTLRGLNVGIHGFGSTVDTRAASGALLSSTRLRMAGGYFGYDANGWDSLGEIYRFANRDLVGGAQHTSTLWYVQVGRNLGSFTPYLRYERAALDGTDPYFASQRLGRSYERSSIGVQYELHPKAALKVELGATREAAATLIDQDGTPVPLASARYRRAMIEYSLAF
jgi:hypothetical protein